MGEGLDYGGHRSIACPGRHGVVLPVVAQLQVFLNSRYEEQEAAPFPTALSYIGPNPRRFADVFSKIGVVTAPAIAGI